MINFKFGINFEFVRDKSRDKIYDETKISWEPTINQTINSIIKEETDGK